MGKKLTQEEFEKRVFDMHNDRFVVVGEYINSHTKLDVFCKNCGYIFSGNPYSLMRGCSCPICTNQIVQKGFNDIWTTHPYIAKHLKNPDDGYKYTYGTNVKLSFVCPNCHGTIYNTPRDLYNKKTGSIRCSNCGDGISYPEKLITNILYQLDIEFKYQLTSRDFKWCNKFRYDFYLPKYNCIIEVHGAQHYINRATFGNVNNFKEIIKTDEVKQKLAQKYVKKYIVIDAKKSEFNYLKESIINSELANMFQIENIDWNICAKKASNSLQVIICNEWDINIQDVDVLAQKYNINKATVYNYLEFGASSGFCSYCKDKNLLYQKEKQYKKIAKRLSKKIICVETGEIFNSIKDAQSKFNIKGKGISKTLTGQTKSAYGFHWKYLNEEPEMVLF